MTQLQKAIDCNDQDLDKAKTINGEFMVVAFLRLPFSTHRQNMSLH